MKKHIKKYINVLHIHSDFKFIHDTERFHNKYFNNTVLVCDYSSTSSPVSDNSNWKMIALDISIKNKANVKEYAKDFDFLVFYDLDYQKVKMINYLPRETKILWRFFGHELYDGINSVLLSDSTKLLQQNQSSYPKSVVNYLYYLKGKYNLYLAKRKVNVVLMMCEEEYDFLLNFTSLPRLITLAIHERFKINSITKNGLGNIIIGNSRSAYNNHIDLLNILSEHQFDKGIKFQLLFNYGGNGVYSEIVKRKAGSISNVEIIDDFLEKDVFDKLYENADALVLNTYRQMALGSIIQAIKQHCKIYLNSRNTITSWLKNNGLKIFTIEDFIKDCKTNNFKLTTEEILINTDRFNRLIEKNNSEEFNIKILDFANE